jgi:hypothetical protein
VDGTGSGLYPMAGFGNRGVEPSGSATNVLDRYLPLILPVKGLVYLLTINVMMKHVK